MREAITHIPYRRDIDGLRAVAVIPVILFHSGMTWLPGGFVGVDIFFVISGFLISTIIFREVDEGKFSFIRFYERRARRILPALIVVLFSTVIMFSLIALPTQADGTARSAIAALFSFSNIFFWMQTGYFSPAVEFMPLLHTWSLAVEEQFYFFFPIIVILISRLRLSIRFLVVAATVLGFAGALWLSYSRPSVAYYLLPARAWELGVGCVVASGVIPRIASEKVREFIVIFGLTTLAISFFLISSDMVFPGFVALFPVIGAAMVLYAGANSRVAQFILGRKELVFVGLVSYSLYLWHWPVMASIRVLNADIHLGVGSAFLSYALTFFLAVVTWRFVERPFRRRDRISPFRLTAFLGCASIGLVLLSSFVAYQRGFPSRLQDNAALALSASEDIDPFRSPCRDRTAVRECFFGNTDSGVTSVILGDSHAAAIRAGVVASGLLGDQGATLLWEGACPFLVDSYPTNHSERARCVSFRKFAWDYLAGLKNLDTIILGGRWPYQVSGFLPESGGAHRTYFSDASTASLSIDENVRVFKRSLERTLNEFEKLGVNVFIIGSTPEAGFDVPKTVALNLFHGKNAPTEIPREFVESRAGVADQIIAGIAMERDFVKFLSIWEGFCSEESCMIELDGKPLFYDDSHLSYTGAMTFASLLLKNSWHGEINQFIEN